MILGQSLQERINTIKDDKFFKNSAINIAGTILGGFLGYLFHFLVSKKLSVAEFGELESLLSFSTILGVTGSALCLFVVRHSSVFAKAKDYLANQQFIVALKGRINRIAFCLFLFFIVTSPLIKDYLHLSDSWGIIILALAIFFTIQNAALNGLLRAWQNFLSLNLILILSSVVKLSLALLIVLFLPKASAVVFALALTGLFAFILLKIVTKKKFFQNREQTSIHWKEKYFRTMNIKKDILFVFLFTLLITVLANMDIMLVKNLSSSEMTGYYSVLSLLGRILLWVNMAIVSVVLPEVYANGRDGSFINRNILFKAYGLIFLTSCAVVLIYYFFPGIVISLLFGEQYLVFQNELWFFAILAFVLSLLQLEANFAYAQHNFNVCYMLLATFLTMIGAIYLSHATIRQMVLSIILSFGLGYLCILVVNLSNTKKQFLNRKTNL